jgi:hypothetical protein
MLLLDYDYSIGKAFGKTMGTIKSSTLTYILNAMNVII